MSSIAIKPSQTADEDDVDQNDSVCVSTPIRPSTSGQSPPNRPGSSTSNKTASNRPAKKRKASEFESLFMEQLEALNKDDKPIDECTRFGDEVAADINKITDPYKRAVAMRDIRNVLFGHLYPSPSPSYTML